MLSLRWTKRLNTLLICLIKLDGGKDHFTLTPKLTLHFSLSIELVLDLQLSCKMAVTVHKYYKKNGESLNEVLLYKKVTKPFKNMEET